jgi:hypothetical protein
MYLPLPCTKQLNTKFFVLITLVFFIILSIFWTLQSQQLEPAINYYRLAKSSNNHNNYVYSVALGINNESLVNKTYKYILLWTKFFESKSWELEPGILGKEVSRSTKLLVQCFKNSFFSSSNVQNATSHRVL